MVCTFSHDRPSCGPHVGHTCSKWNLVSQGKKKFQSSHVPKVKELGFKVGLSFIGYNKNVHFQLRSQMTVLQGLKPPFSVGVANGRFQLALKPTSSKLGTCEDWNSFYLGLPNSVSKPTFSNACGLPFKIRELMLVTSFLSTQNRKDCGYNISESQISENQQMVRLFAIHCHSM